MKTTVDTVSLYRPVGPEELRLVEASGWKKWPPRLPGQGVFYPVTNEPYAREITERWNVWRYGVGYVVKFEVRKNFMDRYEIHRVGGSLHTEWWIPAGDLEDLNANIVGLIEVVGEYRPVSAAEGYTESIARHIECLRKPETPEEAWHSLEDLEGLDTQALPILQQFAASEKDEEIRARLVEAVWQNRRPESVPFLARMLNDLSKKVWKAALDGLVAIGTNEALAALKTERANASAKQLEYIDEAIDQLEHPEAWPGIK
jgi:hypothetical protein